MIGQLGVGADVASEEAVKKSLDRNAGVTNDGTHLQIFLPTQTPPEGGAAAEAAGRAVWGWSRNG